MSAGSPGAMKRDTPDETECEESGLHWGAPSRAQHDTMDQFKMTLVVFMMSGEKIEVDVYPWTTIAEVKKEIRTLKGIEPASQRLLIHNTLCVDAYRISRYTNLRHTSANLTIIDVSGGSGAGSSGLDRGGAHPYAAPNAAPAPEAAPAPAPAPHDSDDEAIHDLLVRDQDRAREAAEAEESESASGGGDDDEEDSGPDHPVGPDTDDDDEDNEPDDPGESETADESVGESDGDELPDME